MQMREINVAITGNAPFLDYDYNTSMMVWSSLPSDIEGYNGEKIKIWKFSDATYDTYDDIRRVSKAVWEGKRSHFFPAPKFEERDHTIDIDFVIHLGMEIRKEEFCLETRARREGYDSPGPDGKMIDSEHMAKLGLPEVLTTSFDIDAAFKRVHEQFPDVACRVSDDAGLYFCEFRLYSSLAEALLQRPGRKGRVIFEHIPQKHDQKAIELATKLTIAYIRTLSGDKDLQE